MKITIFARRFENGAWEDWEHICDNAEIDAVVDSANAKAQDRGRHGRPIFLDYLDGARFIFNVAHGLIDSPRERDTQVYRVAVDQTVIGSYDKFRLHFMRKTM
jgi:hypothetical protein